jgi:hypothetical protein
MASQPSASQGAAAAAATFASLPRSVSLAIFALLPIDTRLRCAEVSRAWCSMIAEHSLWTRLDLTAADSDEEEDKDRLERHGDALLCAASRRADGRVQTLDVTECFYVTMPTLLAVVAANAGALQTLRLSGTFMACEDDEEGRDALAALLGAAPHLQAMYADVSCASADALDLLRGEPPFGPLRIIRLSVEMQDDDAALVPVMAAAVAAHVSLTDVSWCRARLDVAAALDAAVDAVLTCALTSVSFFDCRLTPASVPALARMLRAGALTSLYLSGGGGLQLLDEPSASLLGDALFANSTLTSLTLSGLHIWHNPTAAGTLLSRLVRHPSLKHLVVHRDAVHAAHATFAGAALSALLAADAPALEELSVCDCHLGDAGFGPLVDALPRNSHIKQLRCHDDADGGHALSEAFVRERVLPAVRANRSLTFTAIPCDPVSHDELRALAERNRQAAQHARVSSA